MRSIPGEVFQSLPNLTRLRLNNNHIASLAETGLAGLGSLRRLSLASNRLAEVEEAAWRPVTSLRVLDLASNRISQLNLGYLTTLETLDISDNPEIGGAVAGWRGQKINGGDDHHRFKLPPNLRSLDLSGLRLTDVPSQLLGSVPGLLALYLNGNNFTAIGAHALRPLRRLQRLEIRDNPRLTIVSDQAFIGPSQLVSLNISGNVALTGLPPAALLHLDRLEEVNLTANGLTSLSLLRLADSVESIHLAGNPWLCSCGLQDLQTLALQRNLSVACAEPDGFAGRNILSLDLTDCLSSQSMIAGGMGSGSGGGAGGWHRDTLTIVVMSSVLAASLCIAGFLVYHFRSRLHAMLKSMRGRKPDSGSGVGGNGLKEAAGYSPEYQRSFIQHDEYFISLARQNEPARHIPVTEL